MARRSIGFPLTIGIVLTTLAVVLAVGWQLLVVSDLRPVAQGLTTVHWVLLILGGVVSALIIVGLVLLCAWLVREMRVNQRQQAFLDAVTHEMKTPLASLRLSLDTLDRHALAPERRREFQGRMREDMDRLTRTVEQVLNAARAEARVRKPQRERVELGSLIDRCIGEIRSRHALPEDAIVVRGERPAFVWGDSDEFALVFRNLLENAVKYSQAAVAVEVAIVASGDARTSVEIRDEGIGIAPRDLRKIFHRFYRAGREVQRTVAGLGLGLFIVRSLVRRHGGRVVAQSEGSGRGSRFVVTLRRAPPTEVAEAPALLDAHAQNPAG